MPTVDELAAQVATLQAQQSQQTAAIAAFLEGRLSGGADTVVGHLLALNPGLQLTPAPFAFGP